MSDRQHWAYCDVRHDGTITYYGVADDHRTQARPNVRAVDARRWAEEAVAWLGLQGWELVSVVQGEERTFYLKRPLHDRDSGAFEASAAVATGQGSAEEPNLSVAEEGNASVDPVRLIEEEFLPE